MSAAGAAGSSRFSVAGGSVTSRFTGGLAGAFDGGGGTVSGAVSSR